MGMVIGRQDVKSVEMSAVVIRADGTTEDLGVIAEWHRNPLRRLVSAIKKEMPKWRLSL